MEPAIYQVREGSRPAVENRPMAVLFYLLAAVFIATRLWHLASYPLWLDEVISVEAVRLKWKDLLSWAVKDAVHPPLFYFLFKLWVSTGGETLAWLKLFPALTSFAAIVPFFLFCKELRLRAAEVNTALGLMAVNTYLIHYAQEIRMYSLLFLLSLCSLWLFARFVNGEDRRLRVSLLFAANLLLVYIHLFGWLVVLAEAVYVLLFERRKCLSFSVSVVALIIGFAPWVWLVVQGSVVGSHQMGSNLLWIERPNLITLASYYNGLHGPFESRRAAGLALLLFGFPVVLWIRRTLKGTNQGSRRLLCGLGLFSFLPASVAFIASHLFRFSVFGDRYLIICAAPYLILISVAVFDIPHRRLRPVCLSLILIWAVSSYVYQLAFIEQRIDFSAIVDTMLRSESAKSSRITLDMFEPYLASPIQYYLESSGLRERFEIRSVESTSALTGSHFWVAYRNTNERWKREPTPASFLKDRNCQVGSEMTFGPGRNVVLLPVYSCP